MCRCRIKPAPSRAFSLDRHTGAHHDDPIVAENHPVPFQAQFDRLEHRASTMVEGIASQVGPDQADPHGRPAVAGPGNRDEVGPAIST